MNLATSCLRQRSLLLLALVPLLLAAAGLIYGSHLNARRDFYWDNAHALWLTQPGGHNWQWDSRSDDWKSVTTKPDRQHLQSDGPIELTLLDADRVQKPTSRWLARVKRPDGSGQRDEIEFNFPVYPQPLGTQFVVGAEQNASWLVLDLYDANQTIGELPFVRPANNWTPLVEIDGTNYFVHLDETLQPIKLEVFELLTGGLTRAVRSWPVATNQMQLTEDGKVQSVSLDVSTIETRDPVTGDVLVKLPIPSGVDRVLPAFSWGTNFLFEARRDSNGVLFEQVYDLTTGRPLPLSPATIQQLPRLELFGLWMFVGESVDENTVIGVYNKLQQAVVWQGGAGPGCIATFLDESRIALADRRQGVTIQVIDIHSGRQLAYKRPWWWVIPLLVAGSLYFVVWAFLWVRAAPRHPAWIGFDVTLLALLGIAPLLLRLFELDDRTDVDRLLFAYLQGMFVAWAHLCGVWIVMGRSQRWLLRCVPLTLVVVGLTALLTLIFKPSTEALSLRSLFVNNNHYAWEGFVLTLLPTLISMLCFAMMVAMKFRLVRHWGPMSHDSPSRETPSNSAANSRRGASSHVGEASSQVEQTELANQLTKSPRGQLPLRDMFVAIACVALLIAALKPMLAALPRFSPRVEWDLILTFALAIGCHVGVLILAYSNNRKLFYVGNAVPAVLLMTIIAIPAIDFAQQVNWSFQFIRWRKFFLVSAVSLVWFHAFLLIFRYRYQLRWA